jgi:hypothetical protein
LIKVRVRGIYSTALTKLLLDNHVQIVQPSAMQEERFGLNKDREPYDLDIDDRSAHQGVHILGKAHAVHTLYDLLSRRLPDVVLRRWDVAVDGIYKGLIHRVDKNQGLALVDIGPATGWLNMRGGQTRESEEILVQVQRRRLGARKPSLSADIEIPGEYAVLIPKRQIEISHRIRNQRSRDRLHQLGKALDLDWGIIWRTAAADQSADVLRRELAELAETAQTIRATAEESGAPALLWSETNFMDVEFPALSKKRLDAFRRLVVPTINDHHFYKTCGDPISSAVDMAERLLTQGRQPGEVDELFKRTIDAAFPIEGSTIEIEHVKLDGRIFNLGQAEIVAFNPNDASLTYHRDLKAGGIYDGLGTRKEEGDYAETESKIGEWFLKTRYFSKKERFKGMYINLSTPIELYPRTLRYVDLEVDICIQPDGEIAVLDAVKLEEKVSQGYITQDLAEQVRTKLNDLLAEIER